MAETRKAPGGDNAARVLAILRSRVPFSFLPESAHRRLLESGETRRYAPGQVILRQGEEDDEGVFLVLSGSVESVDQSQSPSFRVTVVREGSWFGERRCVFSTPRQYSMAAIDDCECFTIPRDSFRAVLASHRAFAQALGQILREGQGIFRAFERFTGEVARNAALGHIELRKLLPLYRSLQSALHPLASDETAIDWAALAYASRRLPENVASAFLFLLTDDIPFMYGDPSDIFRAVPSEARHRFVFEMLPGKDLVLIRSGASDLMDFITCLCVHAIETRKIRHRLNHPDLLRAIVSRETCPAPDSLPFSDAELGAMERLWPGRAMEKLREITFHRQAYAIDVRTQQESRNARLPDRWAEEVGEAAERLMGARPAEFPPELEVHVISSNTHSVSNCLNPFFPRRAEAIFAWAESQGLRGSGAGRPPWDNPYDELYALARSYIRAHPEEGPQAREEEAVRGILRLPETLTTGIQVQLVDAALLAPGHIDPSIGVPERPRRKLIVNIDYAFGEQAQSVMRSLLLLFGRNLRSISVMGKAGALLGERGDVLVPTAFVEQRSDSFDSLLPPGEDELSALSRRLGGRGIHRGPMLTVEGTLLQNRLMLDFYRNVWGCVGLEMEGIWYHRAVSEAIQTGVADPGLKTRFLYYVSDLPGLPSGGLSEPLSPREGIPPLYAITREFLKRIID